MASAEWRPLHGITYEELTLQHTVPVGQSFRWRKTGPHTYTGVVGRRVLQLRQQPPSVSASAAAAKAAAASAAAAKTPAPRGQVCWRLASRPTSADELADAEAALLDYLNLGPGRPRLSELARGWAAGDGRYRAVAAALPGARMLRQAPLECLFSFVCSSNNHISRIHGMVERLCARYGSAIELEPWAERELAALEEKGQVVPATPATLGDGGGDADEEEAEEEEEGQGEGEKAAVEAAWAAALGGGGAAGEEDVVVRVELATPSPGKAGGRKRRASSPGAPAVPAAAAAATGAGSAAAAPKFWAFPSLEQLAAASEEALRADGFGYRARYISGSVALLRAKAAAAAAEAASSDDGNDCPDKKAPALSADDWLLSLRAPDVPLERAVELLTELPGVGPKVASCVALFSLDKHSAVPVDTHVWDLAKRHYAKEALRGKTAPVPALHPIVQKAFADAFGPYAGWAHNALFVGELPAFQGRVRAAGRAAAAAAGDSDEDEEYEGGSDSDSDFELRTPAVAAKKGGGKTGGSGSSGKKRPSAEAVAREERQRRRSGPAAAAGGGDEADVPLPFESLLS